MNPDKVKNMQGLQYPNSKTKVRSFLGMVGYYRSFIPDFAGIASPLFNTLKDEHAEKFEVTQEIRESVDKFKTILSQFPVLQYPDFTQMFYIETDASNIRIAAVLMQIKEGKKVLI